MQIPEEIDIDELALAYQLLGATEQVLERAIALLVRNGRPGRGEGSASLGARSRYETEGFVQPEGCLELVPDLLQDTDSLREGDEIFVDPAHRPLGLVHALAERRERGLSGPAIVHDSRGELSEEACGLLAAGPVGRPLSPTGTRHVGCGLAQGFASDLVEIAVDGGKGWGRTVHEWRSI